MCVHRCAPYDHIEHGVACLKRKEAKIDDTLVFLWERGLA